MAKTVIRRGAKSDSQGLMRMLTSLAKFERLEPPSAEGRRRLLDDIFAKKRLNLFVAKKGEKYAGYALYFFTYSSFEARPNLYLEDLFVGEEFRGTGVGEKLFRACVEVASKKGCGRMEWAVLDWNTNAIRFYEKMGAKPLGNWRTYRLGRDDFGPALEGGHVRIRPTRIRTRDV